ncbi:MAG: TetR/AcrR family transcriptional regulator [Ilumatobacteraceae bacterium]
MKIVNEDHQISHISPKDGLAGSGGYPRKRARTRRQLVDAGMAALADHGPGGVTIGDIAGRAGVATGTFYNHFPSMAHLIDAVTDELAGGVEIARGVLEQVERDPAALVAIGTRQLLRLTRADPPAARAFVSLLATAPAFRARVRTTVHGAIDAGIGAGRFPERSAVLTTDAVLGTVVQWMRSALTDEAGPEPEREHLRMILVIVGLPQREIDPVLDRVTAPRGQRAR